MKYINLTLIHCQEFHPFTQAKRKLVTHGEEENERNHHNFHLEQKKLQQKKQRKQRKKQRKQRKKQEHGLDLSTKMILISQPR